MDKNQILSGSGPAQDEWDLPDHAWFCLFLTWQGETKAEEEDAAANKTEEEEEEEEEDEASEDKDDEGGDDSCMDADEKNIDCDSVAAYYFLQWIHAAPQSLLH